MQLLPTFGCFMPSKKDCVISFDGEYPSSLESVYRVSYIININQEKLMKEDAVSWIKIENKSLDMSKDSIKSLIDSMEKDYNIILHTDNLVILDELIRTNIYGFGGNKSVGLSSRANRYYTPRDWFEYIQQKLS